MAVSGNVFGRLPKIMVDWIKRMFSKGLDKDRENFIWCLVGNVVGKQSSENDSGTKNGIKHFSENTKLYCFPVLWGDGYENAKVIGRHRQTSKNVCMIIPTRHIGNWRLQKVYNPYVLRIMQSEQGWTNQEKDKQRVLEMIDWLNNQPSK